MSAGLKTFVETSDSGPLDAESQGSGGVLDAFTAPPILQGVGTTAAKFFADGEHSKVWNCLISSVSHFFAHKRLKNIKIHLSCAVHWRQRTEKVQQNY